LGNVSEKQLKVMRHALGLNYKKRQYRNYFFLHSDIVGIDEKNNLVVIVFNIMSGLNEDSYYCHLTFEAVKLVYGKRISKSYI